MAQAKKAAKAAPSAKKKAATVTKTTAKKTAPAPPKKAVGKKAAPAATKAPAPAKKAPPPAKAAPAKAAPSKAASSKAASSKDTAKAAPAKAAAKAPAPKKAPAPAPAPKKVAPAPRKGDFDAKFLDAQKALLLQERAEYIIQADALKAEADQLARDAEPGDVQFDEESGEGGNTNLDRERDLVLSAQAMQAVEEIDFALVKVTNKTYGYCENCGQPIPKARLNAIPHARLCVGCKSGGLSRR